MVAQQFDLPLFTMRLSFRDDDNRPLADEPQLVGPLPTLPPAARVLLVDDVAVTGRTFERAKSLLPGHAVTTLACKGTADVVLLPEVKRCVRWPWSVIELK
jgi:xanthine phosphoribosyltransferase